MTLNRSIPRLRKRLASGALGPRERCEALLELAELLAHIHQDESGELLREAHAVAGRLRDPGLKARLLHGLGGYCFRQLDLSPALRHLTRAARLYEELGEDCELSDVLCFLANIQTRRGDYDKAFTILDRAQLLADRCGNVTSICNVHYLRGRATMLLGDYKATYDLYIQALARAEREGSLLAQARLQGGLGSLFYLLEEYEQALEHSERCRELFQQLDYRFEEGDLLSTIGMIRQSSGDINGARKAFTESLAIHENIGNRSAVGSVLSNLAGLNLQQGLYEIAHEQLVTADEILKVNGTKMGRSFVLASLGIVKGELGEIDEAIGYLEQALELAVEIKNRRREYFVCRALAEFHERKGDAVRALEYYKRYVRLKENLADQEERKKITQRKMEDVVHRAELEKRELLQTLQAREMLRQGDQRSGWGEFEHKFEMIHADFFQQLARKGGALTPTEMKICSLLKINLSSKEIARILNTSIHTVETHRRHIRKKLGLGSEENLTRYLVAMK